MPVRDGWRIRMVAYDYPLLGIWWSMKVLDQGSTA
jgi:hypothetical protein